MWCCFKPFKVPDTKTEIVNIPKWLNNPEAPEVPEKETPVPDSIETIIVADMVELFILEHSTILMTECEKPIN